MWFNHLKRPQCSNLPAESFYLTFNECQYFQVSFSFFPRYWRTFGDFKYRLRSTRLETPSYKYYIYFWGSRRITPICLCRYLPMKSSLSVSSSKISISSSCPGASWMTNCTQRRRWMLLNVHIAFRQTL